MLYIVDSFIPYQLGMSLMVIVIETDLFYSAVQMQFSKGLHVLNRL